MVELGSNIYSVKTALKKIQKGQVSAFVSALNKTAFEIRDAERAEMTKVFDRPTRFTLDSMFYRYATTSNINSYVAVKNSESKFHYLLPQIHGGNRPQKRFEFMLRRAGILGVNEVTVPAMNSPAVRKDRYGNMASSQIVQILSQLRSFYLAGSSQNETKKLKDKREKKVASNLKEANIRYFVARKGESRVGQGSWKTGEKVQHLKSGIWAKVKLANMFAPKILPVLFFTPKASYRKRFDFYGVAEKTAKDQFPLKLAQARENFIQRTLDTTVKGTRWY